MFYFSLLLRCCIRNHGIASAPFWAVPPQSKLVLSIMYANSLLAGSFLPLEYHSVIRDVHHFEKKHILPNGFCVTVFYFAAAHEYTHTPTRVTYTYMHIALGLAKHDLDSSSCQKEVQYPVSFIKTKIIWRKCTNSAQKCSIVRIFYLQN